MLVILLCAALVAVGIVMVVRWGGRPPISVPAARRGAGAGTVVRRAALAFAACAGAGMIAAGAGGRLVMRLLAVTSPEAEGVLTEAEATIGRVTLDGTLGVLIFVGVPAGILTGVLYALVRPALPAGRLGGAVLGILVLVLVGATIEPLRADNIDFALVGPRWLAVLLFTALAMFQGMLLVSLTQRFGLVTGRPAGVDRPPMRRLLARRAAVVVILAVAGPGFASGVLDILTSR